LKRKIIFLAAIVTVFSFHTRQLQAQSDEKKLEIGGQFSFLRVPTLTNSTGIVCGTIFCPSIAFTRDTNTDVGFGPRIGYNATSYLQARHGAPAELMIPVDGIGALVQAAAAS